MDSFTMNTQTGTRPFGQTANQPVIVPMHGVPGQS
jgi:hypothetical protein